MQDDEGKCWMYPTHTQDASAWPIYEGRFSRDSRSAQKVSCHLAGDDCIRGWVVIPRHMFICFNMLLSTFFSTSWSTNFVPILCCTDLYTVLLRKKQWGAGPMMLDPIPEVNMAVGYPSKQAILRTKTPLRHTGSNPFIGGSQLILRVSFFSCTISVAIIKY